MFARWASLAIGIWLLLAPLILGYRGVGPILHDVLAGYLACLATLAAIDWPRARFVLAALGVWMFVAGQTLFAAHPGASATQLAAGVGFFALSAIPSVRPARARPVATPGAAKTAA